MDSLIECGLPCFEEKGKEKNPPHQIVLDQWGTCCDCCETTNKIHKQQIFSNNDCGCCIQDFIAKSYRNPNIKRCVESKIKQANLQKFPIYVSIFDCYGCETVYGDGR